MSRSWFFAISNFQFGFGVDSEPWPRMLTMTLS